MTDDKKTIDDRLTRNLTPLLRIGSELNTDNLLTIANILGK